MEELPQDIISDATDFLIMITQKMAEQPEKAATVCDMLKGFGENTKKFYEDRAKSIADVEQLVKRYRGQ